MSNTISGIRFDDDGFILVDKKGNDKLDEINNKLQEIYKHLIGEFESRNNTTMRTVYEHDLHNASKSVRRFSEIVDGATKKINSTTAQNKNNRRLVVPRGTVTRIRDAKPVVEQNQRSLSPIRKIYPISEERRETQNNDVPRGTSENGAQRQRDSNGRFVGSGNVSTDKSFFAQVRDAVKSGVSGGSANTDSLDPTVDAIRELGTLMSPIKRASELAFKPLSGLAKLRKRNEPVSREQAKVNTEQTSLLRQINRHSANNLSVMGLARMLPMAGMAIAGAVATVVIPKIGEMLGVGKTPDPAPDDYNKPSAGAISRPSDNALGTGYSLRNTHEGEGMTQIIGANKSNSRGASTDLSSIANMQGGVHEKTKGLIRKYESYSEKPYWDVNHWRGGYASDTYTTKDGKVHTVTKDTRVSKEDAERDLERRTKIFTAGARKSVGGEAWDRLSDESKMVATSMAYNYGSLSKLPSFVNALRTGDDAKIANEVQRRGVDNDSTRMKRRREEANLIRNKTGGKYAPKANVATPSAINSPKAINTPLSTGAGLEIKPLSTVTPSAIKPQNLISPLSMQNNQSQNLIKNMAQPITAQKPDVTTLASNQNVNINGGGGGVNISQNVSDRTLHHAISGGIGMNGQYNA